MRIAVWLWAAALCARGALAADAPTALTVRGERLFLPVELNGHRVEALLDSAAEASLIDTQFAHELGLTVSGQSSIKGSGGEAQAQFAHLEVRAASVTLGDVTAVVVDLGDISRRLVHAPVRFVLGRDLFDAARLRIDIGRGTLEVLDRGVPVAGTELPLSDHAGVEAIPVSLEGIPASAEFDLGNGSGVMIGRAFASAHGFLEPARVVGTQKGGGIGGEIERTVVRLHELTVAGVTFRDLEGHVDPQGNAQELNVGVQVLRAFVIVTDFPQHRIWLAPRASAGAATPARP
ncbi:MAG: aspartyl protease family protein [Proteobacteria bacterium]|nr:aspartyl protease family protein [Pseudomonadota bacterium]